MTILWLSLLILSLLGYILQSNRTLRIPIEFCPFFVVSVTIMTLYVFTYLGQLEYNQYCIPIGFSAESKPHFPLFNISTWLVFSGGLVSILAWFWKLRNDKGEMARSLSCPATLLFVFSVAFLYFLSRFQWFCQWDEINGWSVFVRELCVNGGFGGTDALLQNHANHYPRGCALWNAYVCRFLSVAPQDMIFAYQIFQTSAVFVLIRNCTWRHPWLILTALLFPFCMTNAIFLQGYFTILSDILLGIWFGAILVCYMFLSFEKASIHQKTLILIPPLFVLFAVKEVGLLFAAVIYAIIITDMGCNILCSLVRKKDVAACDSPEPHDGADCPSTKPGNAKIHVFLALVSGILLLTIPATAKISWDCRIKTLDMRGSLASDQITKRVREIKKHLSNEIPSSRWLSSAFKSENRKKFRAAWKSAFTPGEQRVKELYYYLLTKNRVTIPLNFWGAILLFFSIMIACEPRTSGNRFRIITCLAWMLAGCCLYLLFLLCVFMFSMLPHFGAPNTAGGDRYPHTYFLAWSMVLFGLHTYYAHGNIKPSLSKIPGLTRCLIAVVCFLAILNLTVRQTSVSSFASKELRQGVERTEKYFPPELRDSRFAIYCTLEKVPRVLLQYYPSHLSAPQETPKAVCVAKFAKPFPEPCEAEYRNYRLDYYFLSNDPPDDYWKRNLRFFVDGEEAKNYAMFKVTFDADGNPSLSVVKESRINGSGTHKSMKVPD